MERDYYSYKEYDNEIDKLRDELFALVEDKREKEIEITYLNGTIKRTRDMVKKIPIKILKPVGIIVVVFLINKILLKNNGIDMSDIPTYDLLYIRILFIFFLIGLAKTVYLGLYHWKPDKIIKIPFIAKEKSFAHIIEEAEEQVEFYQRVITDSEERITQIRKEIAVLEKMNN
ncbi:MAG: hypothetical protein IJD02_02465 [Lachnospiraceae bacterium]|nr:hypothetical protein [Lachnospiraceae bacterium]